MLSAEVSRLSRKACWHAVAQDPILIPVDSVFLCFHSMEEKFAVFPLNGNFLNDFSTQWKFSGAVFHSMENAICANQFLTHSTQSVS